jgi:hypothetical protein
VREKTGNPPMGMEKGTGTKRDSINLDLSGHHKELGLESDQ